LLEDLPVAEPLLIRAVQEVPASGHLLHLDFQMITAGHHEFAVFLLD